jgi:hypothetical protein
LKLIFVPVFSNGCWLVLLSLDEWNIGLTKGGFQKAIDALRLKFALCAHLFTLAKHQVFAPYAQLITFSPRFGCALRFMPCAQLL